jgi:hypothetical protein
VTVIEILDCSDGFQVQLSCGVVINESSLGVAHLALMNLRASLPDVARVEFKTMDCSMFRLSGREVQDGWHSLVQTETGLTIEFNRLNKPVRKVDPRKRPVKEPAFRKAERLSFDDVKVVAPTYSDGGRSNHRRWIIFERDGSS